MTRLFALPLVGALILGLLFPFVAVRVSTVSTALLVILMLNAGMSVKWSSLSSLAGRVREVGLALAVGYVFFPLLLSSMATVVLSDEQFLYGFVFSTLCPVAMVAPYFCRLHGADADFAMLLVVVTMLLSPFIVPPVLAMIPTASVSLSLAPLARYMLILILLPLACGYLVHRLLPGMVLIFNRFEGLINSVVLGLLFFSLFGTAAAKFNTSYMPVSEIVALCALVFVQDFGVLMLSRFLLKGLFEPPVARALVISLSMKNVAVAAGVLLIYDPRASFAPAVAFVAHAVLFGFLAVPVLSAAAVGRR